MTLVRPGIAAAHPLLRFALRRAIDAVLVLFAAATLAFAALQLAPGDPVDTLLRGTFEITEELRREVTEAYGLDRPVPVQYVQYLAGLLVGDLGTSFHQRRPVAEIIGDNLGATAALAGAAVLLSLVVATAGALLSAGRGRAGRWIAQALELLAISVPSFWVGLLLLTAFSFTVPIFPSTGADGVASLVLPAITLSLPMIGVLGQVIRERLDESLEQPHVLTARTRGAGEARVRVRHALRHSMLPALSISGAIVGSLLAGTAVTETLFSRPGIGRVLLNAIMGRDLPVVMGVVVFAALVFVIVNTIVDGLYVVVDPRTRRSASEDA